MKRLFFYAIILLLISGSCTNSSQNRNDNTSSQKNEQYEGGQFNEVNSNKIFPKSDFCNSIQKGRRILASEGWNVWGASPIMGDDGKVHVFFSRWRGDHKNWLVESEIAHAIADQPEGPYKVIGTVLKGRGSNFWDAHTIHNPTIQKVGDKYALFYIGNNLNGIDLNGDERPSSQRIGLALADDLNGEFKRVGDSPILDISTNSEDWDSYITTNPALLQHPNGELWLYYKAWDKYGDNLRKMGVAKAKSIEGPYVKYEGNPIVSFASIKKQVEDAFVFNYKDKFYMVMRDMGVFHPHVGLILQSSDGLNWSEPKLGYNVSTEYLNEVTVERFERPQILAIDGKPAYIFCALTGGQFKTSTAAVFKLDNNKF